MELKKLTKSFERNKDQYSVAPIEPGSLQSRSRSHLLKFEYGDDHHTLGGITTYIGGIKLVLAKLRIKTTKSIIILIITVISILT